MAADRRVVVVGAGVLGLFTAFELVRDGGSRVTVLDRAHPGAGSSGRSVGMVETQYLNRPRVEVLAWGRDRYAELEADHGLGFVHGGYLRLGRTDDDTAAFERSVAYQRDAAITDADVLSAAEIAARWPHLRTDDVACGLFGAWDGHVDGAGVTALLAGLVRAAGGDVRPRTAVLGADRAGAGWRLDTSEGPVGADVVVNAAGPWAGVVGDLLGAPVPLLPQLHGALTVAAPGLPSTPFVMDYRPGSGTDGVYLRSDQAGGLVAGLHTDEVLDEPVAPDVALGDLAPGVVERVVTALAGRLRGADDLAVTGSWTGLYPMTPDHEPVVGPHPDAPGVVCALGAGGSGIQLSPAVGRVAADAVAGLPARFAQTADWAPARFAAAGRSGS